MANEPTRWLVPPAATVTAAEDLVGGVSVTDYGATGDGETDDTTAVQAAIDAVETAGGIVYFPSGTYIVSAALTVPSNVTLRGEGAISIVKLADGSDCHLVSIAAGVADVTLRDLKLDANGANQTTLDGDGDTVNGIEIADAARVLIDNVEIDDACDTGIHIVGTSGTYATDITVRDCYVHGSGFQCLRARYSERVTLTGNHFADWATASADQTAVGTTWAGEARSWRVIGNHFQNVAGTKFAIETSGRGVVDSVISGNVFDGNALLGNGVSGYFDRCTLTGNTHVNGGGNWRSGYEIVGTDVVIADNFIENGSICIGGNASFTVARINVRGNIITNAVDTNSGIAFGTSTGAMTDIAITGNTIYLSATTPASGIYVGTYGTTGQVNRVTITGNHLLGPGSAGSGVRLRAATGSSDIFVSGNVCSGMAYGLLIQDNDYHDEVTITGNDLRGNTAAITNSSTGGVFRINNNVLADAQAHVFSGGLEVTGDRSDGVALTNLLVALETMGIITDSSTA